MGKSGGGEFTNQFDRDFEHYMNEKFAQLDKGKSKRL